jgi:hypothetical protein
MDEEQLYHLLRRIYCWIPSSNLMRGEIRNILDQLEERKRQRR